eukprot:TRINITY_DN20887_c0_g1_i1.p1 TRINITY_DN20887_c0_g1~~TRINITY_DN20887_c0_g1_i1.p1  ORF type:complete len:469 (+),score=44.13 TRINITY_DN20887_c0_g1_i1:41-1408(+)
MLANIWGSVFGTTVDKKLTADNKKIVPLTEEESWALPIVAHYDYALMAEHVYGDTGRSLPKGWDIFMDCSEVHLNREGFHATAYINTNKQHIVIAERGTIDAAGLRAGIWVYFDEPTIQFMLSEQFSKIVRLKMALQHKTEFTVSYTGHSLGGVLATCRAVAEHTFGVVFETPGCQGFVERIMHPFRFDHPDVIIYVRPPNTINSLKTQVGHVVQLPPKEYQPIANAEAEENIQKKIAQMLPSLSFPSVGEFMGKKILERSVPELYDYVSKIEPYVRDLFDETQQVHSIHNIVPLFEDEKGCYCEPESENVLVWPSHLMQFAEYHSALRGLEETSEGEPHLKAAYESLLAKIYATKKRNRYEIQASWLDPESLKLLGWWCELPKQVRSSGTLPVALSHLDKRVLCSAKLSRETVLATGCTAFQLKQYLFILSRKPAVRSFIATIPTPSEPAAAKL